jgi:hypothetical protein
MEIGRNYSIAANASVTAQVDLAEVVAPSDGVVVIESLTAGQSSDTDSEGLGLQALRGHTTSGSGGSSATPVPDDGGDTAFGGTAEVFNTTLATGGTPVTLLDTGWNVLTEYVWPPRPKYWILNPSQRFVFRTTAAPADALTMRVNVGLVEIGS